MRLPAPLFALAVSLAATAAAAQEPPPAAPAPWGYAPAAPYASPPIDRWWAPPPEPIVTERRSKGMMITGIVFWALGGVATGVGATVLGLAITHPCVYAETVDAPAQVASRRERIGTGRQALTSCDAPGVIGMSTLTAGVLTGALGIPFFVIGNTRVRVKPQLASVPELRVSPTGAAMIWKF